MPEAFEGCDFGYCLIDGFQSAYFYHVYNQNTFEQGKEYKKHRVHFLFGKNYKY